MVDSLNILLPKAICTKSEVHNFATYVVRRTCSKDRDDTICGLGVLLKVPRYILLSLPYRRHCPEEMEKKVD